MSYFVFYNKYACGSISVLYFCLLLCPRRGAYRFHFFRPSGHNLVIKITRKVSDPGCSSLHQRCIPIRPRTSSTMTDLDLIFKGHRAISLLHQLGSSIFRQLPPGAYVSFRHIQQKLKFMPFPIFWQNDPHLILVLI